MLPALAGLAVLSFTAGFAVQPSIASAGPQEINVRCGIYLGYLQQRNQSGSVYGARIGAKHGHPAGGMHCYGSFAVIRSGRAGKNVVVWLAKNWLDWNNHFSLLVTTAGTFATGTACAEAATAIFSTVATDGVASPALFRAGAAMGCATGSYALLSNLPGSQGTGNPGVGLIK